jgi:hypothetical protein
MASKLRTASSVILIVVGVATLILSLLSAGVAYRGAPERIGPATLDEVAGGREGVAVALRARRGTAAAYAAGFATLFLAIVWWPYRHGAKWSWWAIFAGTLVVTGVVLLRGPALGTQVGSGAAWIQLGLVGLALLLDIGRLRKPDDEMDTAPAA